MYEDNLDTIEWLKKNIKREIRRMVMDNFNVRVANVIQQRRAWIENIINYWSKYVNVLQSKICFCTMKLLYIVHILWKNLAKIPSFVETTTILFCPSFCAPPCKYCLFVSHKNMVWSFQFYKIQSNIKPFFWRILILWVWWTDLVQTKTFSSCSFCI